MTPPNDVVSEDSTAPSSDLTLDKTEYTDALLAELDAMDTPEGASDDLLADDTPPPDSPKDATAAKPVESPPDAAVTPTDSTTAGPPKLAELFKDAKPLTYKVDGQERAFDGILEVAGQGAVIAPEHVDRVRNTLGLAEKSIADNRELYARTQEYERLGGARRLADLEEQVAQLDAAGTRLLALLDDPTQLLMQDADGNIVKNPKAIQDLTERLQTASRIATFEAREKFREANQQMQQTADQGQQRQQAIESVIGEAVKAFPGITPQDIETARKHFGRLQASLFREATPEDARQYGVRIGELVIDREPFGEWFQDRVALRASATAHETARQKAEAENRKRQPAPPVVSPRAAKAAAQPRAKDGTFAEREAERQRLKREINAAHRRGTFYSDTDTSKDV